MSQAKLAEAIGIQSPDTISRWENCFGRPPLSIVLLVACCLALKLEFEVSMILISRSGMMFELIYKDPKLMDLPVQRLTDIMTIINREKGKCHQKMHA